jgi:hypothetical protein
MKETSGGGELERNTSLLFPFRDSQNQSSYAEEVDGEWALGEQATATAHRAAATTCSSRSGGTCHPKPAHSAHPGCLGLISAFLDFLPTHLLLHLLLHLPTHPLPLPLLLLHHPLQACATGLCAPGTGERRTSRTAPGLTGVQSCCPA